MHSTSGTVIGTRSENQDRVLVHGSTAMVVDGMGGPAYGAEWASSVAKHAETWLKEHGDPRRKAELPAMHGHILKGSRIDAQAYSKDDGGACYAMITLAENFALVAWIGDCRVGRLRRGAFEWLTVDHNYLEGWKASPRSAPRSWEKLTNLHGLLTRAVCNDVGSEPQSTFQAATRRVARLPGDVFLVCSDGVFSTLQDLYIAEALKAGKTAQDLVESAQDHNILRKMSSDNCTAVIVR